MASLRNNLLPLLQNLPELRKSVVALSFHNRKAEVEQQLQFQGSEYRGNLMTRAAGRQVSPGAEVPYEDCCREVVGHIVARVECSRLVVGPCIACSLRSRVALAPEIL